MDAIVKTKAGFSSHKTNAPIAYKRRWHRDLLIQCTLSPACSRMAPVIPVPIYQAESITLSFAAEIGGFAALTCASEETFQPLVEQKDDALVFFISRAAVFDPVRLANARTIWAARNAIVPLADQLQMKAILADRRTSEHTIEELFAACPNLDIPRATAALLKLACEGEIWISSDHAFDLKSTVFTSREAAQLSANDVWASLVRDGPSDNRSGASASADGLARVRSA